MQSNETKNVIVNICCADGCRKPARWRSFPSGERRPDVAGPMTCDAHLVEVGLTDRIDSPPSEYFVVWPIVVPTDAACVECGNAPLSNEPPGTGTLEEDGVTKYLCGYCWARHNYGGEATKAGKTESTDYGIVDGIAHGEPGAATGNLSVSAVLAGGVHSVASMVVVGSTASSGVDLAQIAMTAEQALRLGTLIWQAAQDAAQADSAVQELRDHGRAAVDLCFAIAEASDFHALVDQSTIRIGYTGAAQSIAERAYSEVDSKDGDWRRAWREAGNRLSKEVGQ